MIADDAIVNAVIANSNCFIERDGNKAAFVIVHGTASAPGATAQSIAEYFQGTENTNNPVSAHYIIGKDGFVVQCNREADGAWANGYITSGLWWKDLGVNPNNVTISIEHVKYASDNSDELTLAQKRASFALIQHICARNNIPPRQADKNGGITGHFSIDPVNRSRCPGNYPFDELWQFLGEQGDAMLSIQQASEFFTEIVPDQRWRCGQTKVDLAYAILNYYRTCTQVGLNGLTQYGLPISGEEAVDGYKGVVLQRFERGVIMYDPNHEVDEVPGLSGPCYPAHIDKGPGQDPRILAAIQKKSDSSTITKSKAKSK